MSILDRLTDDGLKKVIESKDRQIEQLNEMVRYLRADRDRLKQFSDLKTRRIASLTADIAELKKGVTNG
jgi:peptidoglycan hydrolase CwlO-like protein